jgi:hypothetical protein
MILNKHQAKAVSDAMCALNNVNGRIDCTMGEISVREVDSGAVYIKKANSADSERFNCQASFTAAYQIL